MTAEQEKVRKIVTRKAYQTKKKRGKFIKKIKPIVIKKQCQKD